MQPPRPIKGTVKYISTLMVTLAHPLFLAVSSISLVKEPRKLQLQVFSGCFHLKAIVILSISMTIFLLSCIQVASLTRLNAFILTGYSVILLCGITQLIKQLYFLCLVYVAFHLYLSEILTHISLGLIKPNCYSLLHYDILHTIIYMLICSKIVPDDFNMLHQYSTLLTLPFIVLTIPEVAQFDFSEKTTRGQLFETDRQDSWRQH